MGVGVGVKIVGVILTQRFIMPPFQFNSKSAFLTYPQLLNVDNDRIKEDYLIFANGINVDEYCIGLERHENGGLHLHCYLHWAEAFRSRDTRCFDFRGNHPNIQNPRNRNKVISYCCKDGDFLSNCETRTDKRKYGEILKGSNNVTEFIDAVENNYPRDFVLYHKRIRTFGLERWPEKPEQYTSPYTEFKNVPTSLDEWVREELRIVKGT
jgi:hypothetical protein